ncbi:hypothetical protein HOLleu_07005 [Holothuria leucospilota]|uniref:SAM domain-containing protein n=1 Tax=Holothuria leucospilota TaxID=206669 RepID=A0A9Q1HJY1_HOLLE|nr:hypothetical protein HOLleu_07005 [Holothuria leucospilota]
MSAPTEPGRRPSVGINQSCGQPPTWKEPSKVNFPKVPEEKEVCLQFQPDPGAMELFDTDIARILLDNDLPVTVIVQETFHSPRSFLTVDKGVLLTLHLIRRPTRVYATDSNDNDYYLPLCARQLYQVLPMNPVHDDKEFEGTKALINTNLLPKRVRIKEAHYSDHPGEAQEVGDIIEIDRIEKRPVPVDSDNPPQKCIIGTCNGVPLAFSESMVSATYSAMPSIDFLTISEIVTKFSLPLRVRKADGPDFVMILHRKDIEYHVVATPANSRNVLSIPVSWQGKVELLQNINLDKLFRSLLPPLYPVVNTTWGLKEPGRCDLHPSMREVAQPLGEILDDWSRTKEGQAFVLKACENIVQSHKLRIEELLEEKQRLRNLEQMYADRYERTPPVPSRRGDQPPPRPPRTISSNDNSPTKVSNLHSEEEELKAVLQAKEQVLQNIRRNLKDVTDENRSLKDRNSSLLQYESELQRQTDGFQMYASLDLGYVSVTDKDSFYSTGAEERKHFNSYNIDDVVILLREMKLEKYEDIFRENMIDGLLLANLTQNELCDEIGMSRIQAKRILLQVKKLQEK